MYREKFQNQSNNIFVSLYPTTKLWMFLIYSLGTLVLSIWDIGKYHLPLLLIPGTAIVFLLFLFSGKFKEFYNVLKLIFIVLLLVVVVQVFFVKGSNPWLIFQWRFVKIYQYGLQSGMRFCFCITSIAGMFAWVFQTSSNRDICVALQKRGLSYKSAYVFLSTFEMIGVLNKNLKIIMNSQRARGVETTGKLSVRMKAFFPSIVPLVINAFMSAEERVLTLEAKGFDYRCKKTNVIDVLPNGKEAIVWAGTMIYGVAVIGGFIAWKLL